MGNKCDMNMDREVSHEEGSEFAMQQEMLYCESSAKDNICVEGIFEKLA